MLSHFSHVWLLATLWAVVGQAPLPMRFSRQDYWSGLPCPPPGDLPGLNWSLLKLLHCKQLLSCWATSKTITMPYYLTFTALGQSEGNRGRCYLLTVSIFVAKKKKKWNDGMVDSIVISCIVGPNGAQGNECLPNTKDLELKQLPPYLCCIQWFKVRKTLSIKLCQFQFSYFVLLLIL